MSILRALLMPVLLVALLPWGAYLGRTPFLAESRAAAGLVTATPPEARAAKTPSDAIQKPSIKCRKGLPGSPCTPDVKAFFTAAEAVHHQRPRLSGFDGSSRIAQGLAERPALPPPRLA